MNRERLSILRNHLAGLPDERVDMSSYYSEPSGCGTAACIAGWAATIFGDGSMRAAIYADELLGLSEVQEEELFTPPGFEDGRDRYTRLDAISAIDSMLANPDDDALPVWPNKAVSA